MRMDNTYKLLQSTSKEKCLEREGLEEEPLKTWYLKTTTELFKAAVNKVIIARMVANIRNE